MEYARYGAFLRYRNASMAVLVILVTLLAALAIRPAAAMERKLLVFGDSLSAGYNLPPDAAFPVQLQKALKARGVDIPVINAGVSGDTTSAALARVDWALADQPSHALVELGANDMLRGLSPEQAQANLDAIVVKFQQAGVRVMLVGMRAAPNLGVDYGRRFEAIFPAVAKKRQVPLYPFFLDGVAADPELNLEDGMHPNPRGVAVMVERILPQILRFLQS